MVPTIERWKGQVIFRTCVHHVLTPKLALPITIASIPLLRSKAFDIKKKSYIVINLKMQEQS